LAEDFIEAWSEYMIRSSILMEIGRKGER